MKRKQTLRCDDGEDVFDALVDAAPKHSSPSVWRTPRLIPSRPNRPSAHRHDALKSYEYYDGYEEQKPNLQENEKKVPFKKVSLSRMLLSSYLICIASYNAGKRSYRSYQTALFIRERLHQNKVFNPHRKGKVHQHRILKI